MKKTHFILITLFFITNNISINAQEKYFEKQYAWEDTHNGFSILPNSLNKYIISGSSFDLTTGLWSFYAVEIDNFGLLNSVNEFNIYPNFSSTPTEMIKTENGFFLSGWGRYTNINDTDGYQYIMINEQGGYQETDTVGIPLLNNYAYYLSERNTSLET